MQMLHRYILTSPAIRPLGFICGFANAHLLQVRRVQIVFQTDEVLLDTPRGDEAVENRHTARFVVRTTRTSTAEWLLPDDGARALFVVVHVAGGVAQPVRCLQECLAVLREAKGIVSSRIERRRSAVAYIEPVNAYGEVVSMRSSVFSKSMSS